MTPITAEEMLAMSQPAAIARAFASIDTITPPSTTPERAGLWFVIAWKRPGVGRCTDDELDQWRQWAHRLGFVDGNTFPPKIGGRATLPHRLYRVATPDRARGASWSTDPADCLPWVGEDRSPVAARPWHLYSTHPQRAAAWAVIGTEWAIDPRELREVVDLGPIDGRALLRRLAAA